MIDHRLSFKEHLAYASGKTSRTVDAISRIMANTRGPRQPGRRLLVSVVTSTLIYAAPIWARATKNGSYMQDGDSVHRLCALQVCCAFRTVSLRKRFRELTIAKLQERWVNRTAGMAGTEAWTCVLLLNATVDGTWML